MKLNMNTDELSPVGQIEFNLNRLSTRAHATHSSVVEHSQSIIGPLHLFLCIATLGTHLDLAGDKGVRCIIQDQRLWIFRVMFRDDYLFVVIIVIISQTISIVSHE